MNFLNRKALAAALMIFFSLYLTHTQAFPFSIKCIFFFLNTKINYEMAAQGFRGKFDFFLLSRRGVFVLKLQLIEFNKKVC